MAELIFDRTQADVDENLRLTAGMKDGTLTEPEKELYFSELKGRYSYTDLNRVESAVAEIAAKLTANGFPTDVSVKTDWEPEDKMRRADVIRYLNNIDAIRRRLPESVAPAAVPISRWLDYTAANDIERTIWMAESVIGSIALHLRRCGTFTAGGSYASQTIRRA